MTHNSKGEYKMTDDSRFSESKIDSIKGAMGGHDTKRRVERRINKSYTIRPDVANELVAKANEQNLTASRYLENILMKEFDIK